MIEPTELSGLLKVYPANKSDIRGSSSSLVDLPGFNIASVAISKSNPNVLRGLHLGPAKYVIALSGEIFAAIADLREGSDTYGNVITFSINDSNRHGLLVPEGLANSFCVLGNTSVEYLVAQAASTESTPKGGIIWNDKHLAIPWPLQNPTLSDFDRSLPSLAKI